MPVKHSRRDFLSRGALLVAVAGLGCTRGWAQAPATSRPRRLSALGGRLRSPHTIEVPFAFHNLDESRLTAGSATAPALADKVSDAWLAFARTGNPSTPKLPAWPPYDAGKRATMVFDDVSAVAEDPIGAERAVMFEALYPS